MNQKVNKYDPPLLDYLCEPIAKVPLQLVGDVTSTDGMNQSGDPLTPLCKHYSIVGGIPRFVDYVPRVTVESFNDEWNCFNFTDFKISWLKHALANTFGSTDVFKDKLIVDGGARCAEQVVC